MSRIAAILALFAVAFAPLGKVFVDTCLLADCECSITAPTTDLESDGCCSGAGDPEDAPPKSAPEDRRCSDSDCPKSCTAATKAPVLAEGAAAQQAGGSMSVAWAVEPRDGPGICPLDRLPKPPRHANTI